MLKMSVSKNFVTSDQNVEWKVTNGNSVKYFKPVCWLINSNIFYLALKEFPFKGWKAHHHDMQFCSLWEVTGCIQF